MKVLLTGGIGSGKSTALAYLRELSFACYQADDLARRLLDRAETRRYIRTHFGADVFSNEEVDKTLFAQALFAHNDLRRKYEEFVHPQVRRKIEGLLRQHRRIAVEIAILFESRQKNPRSYCDFDCVIAIEAGLSSRIERARLRDKCPASQIAKIVSLQASDEDRRTIADYVVDNSGPTQQLRRQLHQIIHDQSLRGQ